MRLESLFDELKSVFFDKFIGAEITNYVENPYIYIYIYIKTTEIYAGFTFSLQFDSQIAFNGISLLVFEVDEKIKSLIIDELQDKLGSGRIVLNVKEFYPSEYNFSQDIQSDNQLQEFFIEVKKNVEFYKNEVFPKLLDPQYLAEYVGVPFERRDEVVVGGSFPLQFFKKMAILKWGGQEKKYQEYKEETSKLIDKYAIKKPEKYNPLFRENFESLVNHLEKGV